MLKQKKLFYVFSYSKMFFLVQLKCFSDLTKMSCFSSTSQPFKYRNQWLDIGSYLNLSIYKCVCKNLVKTIYPELETLNRLGELRRKHANFIGKKTLKHIHWNQSLQCFSIGNRSQETWVLDYWEYINNSSSNLIKRECLFFCILICSFSYKYYLIYEPSIWCWR